MLLYQATLLSSVFQTEDLLASSFPVLIMALLSFLPQKGKKFLPLLPGESGQTGLFLVSDNLLHQTDWSIWSAPVVTASLQLLPSLPSAPNICCFWLIW